MKGAGLPAARAAGGNEGGGKVGGRRGAETAAVVTAAGSEGRRGASGVCTIVCAHAVRPKPPRFRIPYI